jgi:hypothetical protein
LCFSGIGLQAEAAFQVGGNCSILVLQARVPLTMMHFLTSFLRKYKAPEHFLAYLANSPYSEFHGETLEQEFVSASESSWGSVFRPHTGVHVLQQMDIMTIPLKLPACQVRVSSRTSAFHQLKILRFRAQAQKQG